MGAEDRRNIKIWFQNERSKQKMRSLLKREDAGGCSFTKFNTHEI